MKRLKNTPAGLLGLLSYLLLTLLVGGARAQTNFVPTQAFSGTAGADVNTVTNWVRDTGYQNVAAVLTASLGGVQYMRASSPTNPTIYYYNTISPSADGTQTFTVHTPSAGNTSFSIVGCCARINGNNGYYCVVFYNNGVYSLINYKLVSGTFTQLTGSATLSLTANTAYSGTFRVQGNTLVSTLNGVTETNTDSTFTAAGYSGLYAFTGTASPTDATEMGITNLSATTIAYNGIATTDANLYWSGNWDPGFSGFETTANSGAYLKCAVTGTNSLALNFTPPTVGTIYYKYSLNNGPLQTGSLTSASTSPLFLSGTLSSGATNSLYFDAYSFDFTKDLWGTGGSAPTQALRISAVRTDLGGSTVSLAGTALAVKSKTARTQGDSITNGCYTEGALTPAGSDATHSWSYGVAAGLQCEWANEGFAGQGWNVLNTPGNNAPLYGSSWNFYNNAHAKPFAAKDSYLVVNEGTNNGTSGTLATSGTTGTARAIFAAQRAAEGPACEIVYVCPFNDTTAILSNLLNDLSFYGGGTNASNGYTSLADGNTMIYTPIADPNMCLIDLSVSESTGLLGAGSATQQSPDGLHLLTAEDARKSALVVHAVRAWEAFKSAAVSIPFLPRRGR